MERPSVLIPENPGPPEIPSRGPVQEDRFRDGRSPETCERKVDG
jgi:hypothetical protein